MAFNSRKAGGLRQYPNAPRVTRSRAAGRDVSAVRMTVGMSVALISSKKLVCSSTLDGSDSRSRRSTSISPSNNICLRRSLSRWGASLKPDPSAGASRDCNFELGECRATFTISSVFLLQHACGRFEDSADLTVLQGLVVRLLKIGTKEFLIDPIRLEP